MPYSKPEKSKPAFWICGQTSTALSSRLFASFLLRNCSPKKITSAKDEKIALRIVMAKIGL
jgi:hypothetical protein